MTSCKFAALVAVLSLVACYASAQVKVAKVHPTPHETASAKAADKLERAGLQAEVSHDFEKASQFYAAAAEKDPEHAKIWDSVGFAYEMLHQYDKALAAYDKAIEHDPHEQYAYKHRGTIYDLLGRYDDSIREFRKQLEITPQDVESHGELSRIYMDQKKYDLALTELQAEAKNVSPSYAFDLERGEIELGLHHDDAALADFHSALEHPTPMTSSTIATALADNGVHLDVAEQLATVTVHAADAQSLRTSLAAVTYDSAGWTGGLASAWDTMGWVRFAQHNLKAAEIYTKASWVIDDQSTSTAFHLGQIYEKEGRRDDAIRAYALSLSCEMPPVEARERLGALVGDEKIPAAIEAAERELADSRATQLANPRSYTGTAQFWILLSPSTGSSAATVTDVKFISADGKDGKKLREYADQLRSASLPYSFPPAEQAKLLVCGALACTASNSPCAFTPYGIRETRDTLFASTRLKLPKGVRITADPH